MSMSIIEAIKMGQWDYEPEQRKKDDYTATEAIPGSNEKLAVLAERLRRGLPLWHPSDRLYWQDSED
jgi:hypothetical protein